MEGGQVQALDSLVTQCPTCPIAALLYALVSDAERPYLNRPSQRKPLSVSDICPAKLVIWHPVIPNGGNPLHGTGANSNPTKVRPGAVLGYPNLAEHISREDVWRRRLLGVDTKTRLGLIVAAHISIEVPSGHMRHL